MRTITTPYGGQEYFSDHYLEEFYTLLQPALVGLKERLAQRQAPGRQPPRTVAPGTMAPLDCGVNPSG